MSQPAVSLDDIGYQDLRFVADRLLETSRVEYLDGEPHGEPNG